MVNRIILFLFCALLWACSEENEVTSNVENENQIDWYAAADSSSTSLINSFWNVGSRYFNYDSNGNTTFHYWPQAHA